MSARTYGALREGRFQLADGPIFEGYTDGHLWNGYAWPLFTHFIAMQVAARASVPHPLNGYDPIHDSFTVYLDADEPILETYEGTDVQGLHLYDFQQYGWCWDEVPEDLPTNAPEWRERFVRWHSKT